MRHQIRPLVPTQRKVIDCEFHAVGACGACAHTPTYSRTVSSSESIALCLQEAANTSLTVAREPLQKLRTLLATALAGSARNQAAARSAAPRARRTHFSRRLDVPLRTKLRARRKWRIALGTVFYVGPHNLSFIGDEEKFDERTATIVSAVLICDAV